MLKLDAEESGRGDLRDLPYLVRSQQGGQFTPTNVWPADRPWLVYTNYDLWATRVSGSTALSGALTEHGDLDTVRCG